MTDVIEEIEALEHFKTYQCGCGGETRYHCLQIYIRCSGCLKKVKCRAFGGIGTEIQDVIDAVLMWAGEGESFDAVMERRKELIKK